MRAVRDLIGSLFDQPSSRVGVLDNPHENRLFFQNIPTLATSHVSQEALDLLLITAATNPLWEPRDENESTQTITELLARGANINAVASDGFTALMIAAKYGHTEIVSALLSCDRVNVNAARYNGVTALMLAAQSNHTEIVSALLSREEINVNAVTSNGFTALMLAAQSDHAEIVSALLSREEINVNAAAPHGTTALIIAARNGHIETVLTLLSCEGINVNAAKSNGFTALMLAAQSGYTETVSALLSKGGIDVNAVTSNGFTALMIAAQSGHTEIVSALLSCEGINVNEVTSNGFTALMLAAKNGRKETVLALLSRDVVDWQIVQNQLSHPALQNLNKEVSFLLAVILPDEEPRNSVITSFNQRNSNGNSIIARLCQRNPDNSIQQENNDILGAGLEAYKNLKDLKSWHVRYLTDSGVDKDKVEILANQRFFDLLNHQGRRKEAFTRNDLVTDLVSKSKSSAVDFVGLTGNQRHLEIVSKLSPEDLYKLTTKIIDKSKGKNGRIPTLQASSLVAVLRNFEIDQTPTSPGTTIHRNSKVSIATPIMIPRKGEPGVSYLFKPRSPPR